MTDERGGRYFREARFFLAGDKVAAQSHILEARSLLGYMRDQQAQGGPAVQVQYATLQDGTQIKATLTNGQYQAQIFSPSRVDEDDGALTRGFVLVLTEFDVSAAARASWSGAWDSAILFGVVNGVLRVREFQYPVSTNPPTHLKYSVAATGGASGADQFHDVFTRLDDHLYRNAVGVASLPPGNGMPYIHPDDVATFERLFDVTDSGVSLYEIATEGLLAQYVFGDFYQPIVSGWVYTAGAGLTGNALGYCGMNVTPAGAVQVWSARAAMLNAPPWLAVTESFYQQNVAGVLRSSTGWVVDTTPAHSPPLIQPTDMRICDTWAGTADQWYFAGYITAGSAKVISGVSDTYTYNKTLGDNATIPLAGGANIVSTRAVDIQNVLRVDDGVAVAGTWPYSDPLINTIFFDDTTRYLARSLSISFDNRYQGDPVATVSVQTVDNVEHTDVATSQATHSDLPRAIQDTTSTTTQSATYGIAVDSAAVMTTELGPINLGGDNPPFVRVQNSGRVDTVGASTDTFVRTYSSTATARDYLYSDVAEDVFVWVEGTVTSEGQETPFGTPATGSHSAVVVVVVYIRGVEHSFPLYTKSSPTFAGHQRYVPDDVNFGTLPGSMYWSYASPALPKPVYAPVWCTQGLCPHIAYTTKAEELAGVTPHFALSLRLQGRFEKRSVLGTDPDPPTPPIGTLVVRLPNIERVFEEWGTQVRYIFLGQQVSPGQPWEGGIEQKCVSIDFASPGDAHYWIEDLGAPVTSLGTDTLVGGGSFADSARDYYPDRYNGQIYRT